MAGIITTESMVAGATGLRMAASANMAAANMPAGMPAAAGMAAEDTAKSPDTTTRMILVPREARVHSGRGVRE